MLSLVATNHQMKTIHGAAIDYSAPTPGTCCTVFPATHLPLRDYRVACKRKSIPHAFNDGSSAVRLSLI